MAEMVLYNGRMVPREAFAAFVYAPDGQSKLVKSWHEYEKSMQSGLWHSTKLQAADRQKSKKKGG